MKVSKANIGTRMLMRKGNILAEALALLLLSYFCSVGLYLSREKKVRGKIGQYYSLSRTNASRPGGYAGGRPGEDEYCKRNARPEGEGTRDSPSSRAAGCKGEGCRKQRWTSSVAIGHSSVPSRIGRRLSWAAAIRRVGGRECFKIPDRQQTAGLSMEGGLGARRPRPTQQSAVGR
jgi:hypothetical protein